VGLTIVPAQRNAHRATPRIAASTPAFLLAADRWMQVAERRRASLEARRQPVGHPKTSWPREPGPGSVGKSRDSTQSPPRFQPGGAFRAIASAPGRSNSSRSAEDRATSAGFRRIRLVRPGRDAQDATACDATFSEPLNP